MKVARDSDMAQHRQAERLAVELWRDACGAIAVEYGLIAALIALVLIGSIAELGETLLGLPLQALIDAFMGSTS